MAFLIKKGNFAPDKNICKSKKKENFMEKRIALFFACFFMSMGIALAQIEVSGTVISQDDGEPVIGASVVISGG